MRPADRRRAADATPLMLADIGSERQRGLLQRIHHHAGDVEAGLLHDFLEAGGARHVDFGQIVADHVEPDEQQALRVQDGRERFGDLAVARGKRTRDAGAAGREVAAGFARLRNARERKRAPACPRSAARACRRRGSPGCSAAP